MFQDFLIVSKEDENERVDKFLATRFPDFTRSFIQKAIKNGQIKLNGKDFKSNYKHTISYPKINH